MAPQPGPRVPKPEQSENGKRRLLFAKHCAGRPQRPQPLKHSYAAWGGRARRCNEAFGCGGCVRPHGSIVLLGRSWGLGAPWKPLGDSAGALEDSLGTPGELLGALGCSLGALGDSLGTLGSSLETPWKVVGGPRRKKYELRPKKASEQE